MLWWFSHVPARAHSVKVLNWTELMLQWTICWLYFAVNHLFISRSEPLVDMLHWFTCWYFALNHLWVCWSEAHVNMLKWATCGYVDVSHLWVSWCEPFVGILMWATRGYVVVSHFWVCCSDHWSASLCNWQDVKIQQPTTNWLLSTLKWVSCWCCCCCDHLSAGCREPLVVYYSDHLLSCCSDLLLELLECCREPLVGMLWWPLVCLL